MRSGFLALAVATLLVAPLAAQNQSATFTNGTSGSIDVPYNAALMAPSAITVEAWVTYDGSTLGTLNRFPTIARGNVDVGWSYFLRVNAGSTNIRQLRWAIGTPSGNLLVNWDFNPGDLLCWTHIAATYDGVTSRLFVNGQEVAQAAGIGPMQDNGGTIGIGEGKKDPVFQNEIWNGQLDEVRIWSVALTPAQIAGQMFATISTAPGLEGSWHLDGDLVDATGNGNDGTMFGSFPFALTTLPTQFEYETNDAAASLDIDGEAPTALCGTQKTVLAGELMTINVASTLTGNLFDLVLTAPSLTVPASGGGLVTGGGQIVNLDIFAPGLASLFGGFTPFAGNFSLPVALPFPFTAAAQMVILDPSHPDGVALSAGIDINVIPCPTSTNFEGLSTGIGNYPLGWSNGAGTAEWSVGTGTTPSTGTGPIAGAFSAPNYMFCETSSPNTTATFRMDTCTYDVFALSTFTVDFRLSRIGATIGTLNLWMDDGSGTFSTLVTTYTGPEPTMTDWTPESVSFIPNSPTVAFRFEYIAGGNFTGDLALDDVSIQ